MTKLVGVCHKVLEIVWFRPRQPESSLGSVCFEVGHVTQPQCASVSASVNNDNNFRIVVRL